MFNLETKKKEKNNNRKKRKEKKREKIESFRFFHKVQEVNSNSCFHLLFKKT